MDMAGKVVGGAAKLAGGIASKLGLGGGGKGSSAKGASITTSSLRTSLKPIIEKLTSMDSTLKSIDNSLKGKFINQ